METNKNSFVIRWPEKGKDPRQSGRYPSYSCFESCTLCGVVNEYRRGDHVLVRVMPNLPIMVVEILHIWRETKKALGETGGSVRLKLYSRPEDTSSGRNHHHGQHELLLFHKTVVVTCEQLVKMEVCDSDWTIGLPLHPPKGITPSPPPWEVNSNGTSLLCREKMTPIGIFESEDQIGASPTASPVLPRNNTSLSSCKLLVVSIERFNRHCAVFRRLGQFAYDMMDQPLVQAMGGVPAPKEPTMLAFCRRTFRDGALEKSIMGAEGVVNSVSVIRRLIVEQGLSCQVARKPVHNKIPNALPVGGSRPPNLSNSVVPAKRRGGWPKGKPRKKKIDGLQKPVEQEKRQPGRRGRPRKIRPPSLMLERSVMPSSNPDVRNGSPLTLAQVPPPPRVVRRGRPPKRLKFTNIIGMPHPQPSKIKVIKTAPASTQSTSPEPSSLLLPPTSRADGGSLSSAANTIPMVKSEPLSQSQSVIKTSNVTMAAVPSHSTPTSSSSSVSPVKRGRPIKHKDFSDILSLPQDQISPVVKIGRPPKYEESSSCLSAATEPAHVTTGALLPSQHNDAAVTVASSSSRSLRAMLSPTRDAVSRPSVPTTTSPSISSLVTLLQNAWRSPAVPNNILLPKLASTISSMNVPGPASAALPNNPMANQINQLAILSQLIMQSYQKVAQATASINNAMANGGLTAVQSSTTSVGVSVTGSSAPSRHLAPKTVVTSPSPPSSPETTPPSSHIGTPSPFPPSQLMPVSASSSSSLSSASSSPTSSSSFLPFSHSSQVKSPSSKMLRPSPPPLIHVKEADTSHRSSQQLHSSVSAGLLPSPTNLLPSTAPAVSLSSSVASSVSTAVSPSSSSLIHSPSSASFSLPQGSVSSVGASQSSQFWDSPGHIPELVPVNPPLSSLLAPPEVASSSSSLTEDPMPLPPLEQQHKSREAGDDESEPKFSSISSDQHHHHPHHNKRELELSEEDSDHSLFPSASKKPRADLNWDKRKDRVLPKSTSYSKRCSLRQKIQRPTYFRELYDFLYEPASFQKPVKTPGARKSKRGRHKKHQPLHSLHLVSSPPSAHTSPSSPLTSSLTSSSSPPLLLPSLDAAVPQNKPASLRVNPPSLLEHETTIKSIPQGSNPTSKSSENLLSSQLLTSSSQELQMEEKAFAELLFIFMQLRNTPITRIPLLGSKRLNLYELFKVTTRMGGYEKVTSERKWSSVFDILCGTEMTCASTVTRKHYEKFLLPFERALAATKRGEVQTPLVQQNAAILANALLSNSMPSTKAPVASD